MHSPEWSESHEQEHGRKDEGEDTVQFMWPEQRFLSRELQEEVVKDQIIHAVFPSTSPTAPASSVKSSLDELSSSK